MIQRWLDGQNSELQEVAAENVLGPAECFPFFIYFAQHSVETLGAEHGHLVNNNRIELARLGS